MKPNSATVMWVIRCSLLGIENAEGVATVSGIVLTHIKGVEAILPGADACPGRDRGDPIMLPGTPRAPFGAREMGTCMTKGAMKPKATRHGMWTGVVPLDTNAGPPKTLCT